MSSGSGQGEAFARWAATLGTGPYGEVPALRVYDGWIVDLPPGKNAGDEVSPTAATYGVVVMIDGKLTRVPGMHMPSDVRWSDLPGIDLLVVPPKGTPIRLLDVSGEYRLLMMQQELPAVAVCTGGARGGGDAPGPQIEIGSMTAGEIAERVLRGSDSDRSARSRGIIGSVVSALRGRRMPQKRKIIETKILDQRYEGDQLVFDCTRIIGGVQVYASVEDGTISTGSLAVERSFDGVEWVAFDPAISINTDDASPFAVDATLLHSVRVRVDSSTAIDPARWRVTIIGVEEAESAQ